MEIIFITGLSGAGKSQAVSCLEDIGYYCIDNMPPVLIKNFIVLSTNENSGVDKIAFVVDSRGGDFLNDLTESIEYLKENDIPYKIIFLEASNEVLVRRYNETRRVHPLTKKTANIGDIEKEREMLKDLRSRADYVIDTSNMKSAKLRSEIVSLINSEEEQEETFVVNIVSFGYKNGIPLAADMVFDMRFIPNPFYVPSMKRLTGNSKKVRNYVMKFQESKTFVKNINKLINDIVPCFMKQGKFNLNIAFGCTGGQHRSVAMANEIYDLFTLQGKQVTLDHRDIKRR
ncbi:MAG: RNase adapter RapZ [Anaerovoracaceae bacterium]|nr:RNase adapter RapZ [Anaerovoracaceae bacterium]